MNIQSIAKLANVSASTVSKVINNKDSDISEVTRKKVLDVVKEYQYSPYSAIKNRLDVSPRTVGVIFPSLQSLFFPKLLETMERTLSHTGYSMMVYCSEGTLENEKKCLDILTQKNVEGILFYPSGGESAALVQNLDANVVLFGAGAGRFPKYRFHYEQAAYLGVRHLIAHNHTKIGCIFDSDSESYLKGYMQAITEASIRFDQTLVLQASDAEIQDYVNLLNAGVTSIFCATLRIASQIYAIAQGHNLKIPEDISVVACDDTDVGDLFIPPVTVLSFPIEELGARAAKSILRMIETRKRSEKETAILPELHVKGSVCPPKHLKGKKIVVIGSLNMDTLLNAAHIPQKGETIMAGQKIQFPGGKGANQAVGASRLNGNVYMIGRLGSDQNGREMYNNLLNNHVNTDGVVFDSLSPTGTAYITVDANGNNSIIVHGGANDNVDKAQLDSAGDILDHAAYALIQMEIPINTVKYAIEKCRQKQTDVILKPAPAQKLPAKFYKGLYLIIPNETEAGQLCPEADTVESQARFFLEQGVRHVIITLAEKGCYYTDGNISRYYEAADFQAVDSTGASDSFISALVVRLAEGAPMEAAIRYATYAAGISVTKAGVQSALPEHHMVARYME